MVFDIEMIKKVYSSMKDKVDNAKKICNHPLTLSEKILYSHLWNNVDKTFIRGVDYVDFAPDRIACQDATAQMALLQFMQAGKSKVAVPTTVHCDHLIQAKIGAGPDLQEAINTSNEVFNFLESVSNKYGIGFWKPGAGIIHQVVLENYAFPGGMMIGTDSHTVNAGGLGMVAIGEPVQEALTDGSQFMQYIKRTVPETTTVTIWVYPNSFDDFRKFKNTLFAMGFACAGRPLPEGLYISASPHGTKSVRQ